VKTTPEAKPGMRGFMTAAERDRFLAQRGLGLV
jgi:hypothetical protein